MARHEAKAVQQGTQFFGTLVSRIIVVEREPLVSDEMGVTAGQLIDRRLEKMREDFARQESSEQPGEQPEIQSITLEFPTRY
jgi:hypothetical protein